MPRIQVTYMMWLLFAWRLVLGQEVGWSAYAYNIVSGQEETWGMLGEERSVASVWKVVTAAIVVEKLGKDFQFVTPFYLRGSITEDGVLHGDIVVMAQGDPTWSSRRFGRDGDYLFSTVLNALTERGIQCILGDIVIMDSRGTDVLAPTWLWEDIGNYYGCGAWGLNYKDNVVLLNFRKGDKRPELDHIVPQTMGYQWLSQVEYGQKGSGDQAYVFAAPRQKSRAIRGSLGRDMKNMVIKAAHPDPIAYFREDMKKYLEQGGIQLSQDVIAIENAVLTLLVEIKSPPLSQMIQVGLEVSDNLIFEALGRTVFKSSDYRGFLSLYSSCLKEYRLRPEDACGLSPLGRFSVKDGVLFFIEKWKAEDDLLHLLPPVQRTSLGPFFKGKTDLRVKSGSMKNVTAYMGVKNSKWVFCLVYNGSDLSASEARRKMARWIGSLGE